MFLKQMILQQKEKYRYAYKFNGIEWQDKKS